MSRYDLFRKRIAPIAFVLAMGLLIRESCQKNERIHATIVLDFGDAAPRVRAVEAKLLIDDDVIGEFRRAALPGLRIGVSEFKVALPAQDAELRIDVDLGGDHRKIVRLIHAEEGATITVPLASGLR